MGTGAEDVAAEALAAILGEKEPDVEQVDPLRVIGIAADLAEVRARGYIVGAELPACSVVRRAVNTAFRADRLDRRVDDVGLGATNRERDPTNVTLGESGSSLLPALAAIGGLEDARLLSTADEVPGSSLPLISRGV